MSTVVQDGETKTILAAAATTQVKAAPGSIGRLFVTDVGTTMTIDIYDATSGTTNQVVKYVSADGKVDWQLGMKMDVGIRVIVGGTPGRAVLVWS